MGKSVFAALTTKAAPTPAPRNPQRAGWRRIVSEPFTGAWQLGMRGSDEDLLKSPIVFACITRIANDIGKLRALSVKLDGNGIWVEKSADAESVLHKPNHYQTAVQFRQYWTLSKLRAGNTYGLKVRGDGGKVKAIHVLEPSLCLPLVASDGSVFYQLGQDNLAGLQEGGLIVPASEIIHDRCNCLYHPLVGVSPLSAAAIAAGIGTKIQDNMLQFYTNYSTPSGLLIAPGTIEDDDAKSIQERWQEMHAGANVGGVAVLGENMKYQALSTTATDAQLIETLGWSDERVCSVFHVPGFKVGVGTEQTHANAEVRERAYYSDCLQVHIEEMEACLDLGLGYNGYSEGVSLDTEALMRMDSQALMKTLAEGVKARILPTNSALKRLNHPPVDGGDVIYLQQQDYPMAEVRHNKLPPTQAEPTQGAADPAAPLDAAPKEGA